MTYRPDGLAETMPWRWIALESAFLFVLCAFLFHWSLASDPGPLEGDTLFHYKMARLVLERGPWVSIDNLPYTVLGNHGTDHYWFFHVLVSPLTLLGDDAKGILLACALSGAAVPALFLPLLRRNRVPWAPIVALLMVSASTLLPARLLELRGQNFALPMMIAVMFALLARRRWLAGIGAFVFMQGYQAAVLLAMIGLVVAAAQRYREGNADWRAMLAVLYGGALGLVLSPWFPENVRYLVFTTLFKVGHAEYDLPGILGTEWWRPGWIHIANEAWLAHVVFFASLAVAAWLTWRRRVRWSTAAMTSVAVTLAFLAMYRWVAWRMGEYYAPFAVLSAGLIWRDAWPVARAAGPQWMPQAPALALAALLAAGLQQGLSFVTDVVVKPVSQYQAIMRYVDSHDAQPMVFNSSWSEYMVLFYHSDNAKFVAGMDGHYLLYGDPQRFRLWYSISFGGMRGAPNIAATIHDRFAARWAVIARSQQDLASDLSRDRDARLVALDGHGWLFELKGAGQEWPRS